MRSSRFITLLAPFALPALLFGSTAAANASTAIVLRYHFTIGRTIGYKANIALKEAVAAGPQHQTISIRETLGFTQRVSKVYADGSALVVATYTNATITANGRTQPLPLQGTKVSLRISATGETHASVSGPATSALGGGINVGSTSALPTHPVAVNDSWTTAQTISLGSLATGHVTQRSTLVSLNSVGGDRVANIRTSVLPSSLSITTNGVTLTGDATGGSTSHFDADAGVLESAHTKVHIPFKGTYQGANVRIILDETADTVRTA